MVSLRRSWLIHVVIRRSDLEGHTMETISKLASDRVEWLDTEFAKQVLSESSVRPPHTEPVQHLRREAPLLDRIAAGLL
jgi:hypothetical protein